MMFKLKSYASVLILGILFLSSCTRPSREVFHLIPETAQVVVTFHPKKILEKGKIEQIDFLDDEIFGNEVLAKIIQNPTSSGVRLESYGAAFMVKDPKEYDCIILPIMSKRKFEQTVIELTDSQGSIRESGKMRDSYDVIKTKNCLVVYGSFAALIFYEKEFANTSALESITNDLLLMGKESSIIADKDFNLFLRRQQDLNAWFNTSNFKGMSLFRGITGGISEISGLKNNYGHVFVDFQKGNMALTTNLRFNRSMQSTIDKFNIMDEKAIKDLLNYLPSQDLVFIMNNNIDPERVFDLLEFIGHDFEKTLNHTIDSLALDPEQVKNSFSGEFALSFHGVKNSNFEGDKDKDEYEKFPYLVAAFRIKDKSFFEEFLSQADKNPNVIQTEGYYIFQQEDIAVYMLMHGKDLVFSTEESVIKEIAAKGSLMNNVTKSEIGPVLSKNPVCFFLNLDKRSYSRDTDEFLRNSMGSSISEGMETFGEELKSLTFSANLKEWEMRIDLKDTKENSLYTLLRQVDKNRFSKPGS